MKSDVLKIFKFYLFIRTAAVELIECVCVLLDYTSNMTGSTTFGFENQFSHNVFVIESKIN